MGDDDDIDDEDDDDDDAGTIEFWGPAVFGKKIQQKTKQYKFCSLFGWFLIDFDRMGRIWFGI